MLEQCLYRMEASRGRSRRSRGESCETSGCETHRGETRAGTRIDGGVVFGGEKSRKFVVKIAYTLNINSAVDSKNNNTIIVLLPR